MGLGYFTGLGEYVLNDMLPIRSWALTGYILIVCFQCCQPKVAWIPTGYNTIFSLINIYHLNLLLKPLPALSAEEAALYEALGGEDRLPVKLFHNLLSLGTWKVLNIGEALVEANEPVDVHEISLIASGTCHMQLGGLVAGRLGAGSIVGEAWALDPDGHQRPDFGTPSTASVIAVGEDVRILAVPL